jgi:hypothetical protein
MNFFVNFPTVSPIFFSNPFASNLKYSDPQTIFYYPMPHAICSMLKKKQQHRSTREFASNLERSGPQATCLHEAFWRRQEQSSNSVYPYSMLYALCSMLYALCSMHSFGGVSMFLYSD